MFTSAEAGSSGGARRKPAAVVIGAGFGGLAAAIRLGARGYDVTVVERLDSPGGRACVHRMGGFTFDAGPTIVTAPFLFEELWRLAGRRMSDDIDLRAMDPFYKIRFPDGATFAYSADTDAMRAEVERFSPGEASHYDAYLKMSEAIYRIGFEKLGAVPFDSVVDMARVAPDLLRLQGYRSVYGLVSRFFRDERLRMTFSFHPLLIGGDPFSASSIYCLIAFLEKTYGVHSPIGGVGALVCGLVNLIEGQGALAPERGRAENSCSKRRRDGRGTRRRRAVECRHRGFQCGFCIYLPPSRAGRRPPTLDRRQARPGAIFDGPVCLLLRR